MSSHRWCFSKEHLLNSPSRRHGTDEDKELLYLQRVSNCIQDMGRELALPLLCMNTAILFTQRFYVYHPLSVFEKFSLGATALFLAAKVEEHPRKVEDVCKVARRLGLIPEDVVDQDYIRDLLFNENILLQTLGFEVQVRHPHQDVLLLCDFLKVSKHLAKTAYILATYCLHLTKMCLSDKPAVIACVSIHTAAKMLSIEMPTSCEGKAWFLHAENSLTLAQLDNLTIEFVNILKKCPDKFKSRTLKNLVKKLSLDSTSLALFQTPNEKVPASPAMLSEALSDGLHSTLKEEYSLITSSLQYESNKNQGDLNKIKPTATTVNSRSKPVSHDVSLLVKSSVSVKFAVSRPLASKGDGHSSHLGDDNTLTSPISAFPSYIKTEKVNTSVTNVISVYSSDPPSRTKINQGNFNTGIKMPPSSTVRVLPSSTQSSKSIAVCSRSLGVPSQKKLLPSSTCIFASQRVTTACNELRKTLGSDNTSIKRMRSPSGIGKPTSDISNVAHSTLLVNPRNQISVGGHLITNSVQENHVKEPSLKISIPKSRIWCMTEGKSSSSQLPTYEVKKLSSPVSKRYKLN